jgi:hypothetical protein
MINDCQHHALCDQIATISPTRRQRTLVIIDGFLSLGLPSDPPARCLRRTPAGKAVRNIANTPIFSTTDPSLTAFLRFPPEIRLQIYSYLLISGQAIQRGICPIKFCLVELEEIWASPRQVPFRHRLFPTILECCRKINEEGSAVLYGKNMFEVERHRRDYCSIVSTWSPARAKLLSITRLSFTYYPLCECMQDRKIPEIMVLFPALSEVKICLQDVLVEELAIFLVEASDKLQWMKRFLLEIQVNHRAGQVICRQWQSHQLTDEGMCRSAYQEPLLKQQSLWKNRGVRWEWDPVTHCFSRAHGVLGTLKVFVE